MIPTQLTRTHFSRALLCAAAVLACVSLASAQPRPSLPPNSPFAGGVPEGMVTKDTLSLTVFDVIERALRHNLGVLLSEQSTERASGTHAVARAELLPNLTASASVSRRKKNLEAFGFPLDASPLIATFPRSVGPFTVFDARVFLTQSVFDLSAINEAKAEGSQCRRRPPFEPQRPRSRRARRRQRLPAGAGRAARARLREGAARDRRGAPPSGAVDLRESGLVAGLDVIRAEVRLTTERQRATAAENDFQKSKLQLARVIGSADRPAVHAERRDAGRAGRQT